VKAAKTHTEALLDTISAGDGMRELEMLEKRGE